MDKNIDQKTLQTPKTPKTPKPRRFDFSGWTKPQKRTFSLYVFLLCCILALGFMAAFFFVLKGAEKVMVPNIRGMDLADALVSLQERELYPRLALRFTNNPLDKNTILEQSPEPGSIVKAGRRIKLTVSRGAVLDTIENYVGKDLEAVKLHLQTLFSSSRPLVTIREPPMYRFDDSSAGTILEQKPIPKTEISGPTVLEFIVSKGPESQKTTVPRFIGETMVSAIRLAEKASFPVDFSMRQARAGEAPGSVIEQKPSADTEIRISDRVEVVVTAPSAGNGMIHGVYVYKLVDYPYPVPVKLEAISPEGQRRTLASMKHPGGNFSIPFTLAPGTTFVLTVLDREMSRTEVGER
jgi:beta-lactam-binding protein with PASTA domain